MVNNLLNSIENYTEKKRLSQDFQKLMEGRAGLTKSIEIQGCAHVLNFISDKEFEKHRVWRMITCKDPFCPMCAWRKARKDMIKIGTIMKWIKLEHDKEIMMMTMTYKRVYGYEFRDMIKIRTIMKLIKLEHDKEFLMLTLTYKRVYGYELRDTINKFQESFNRMFNRKRIKEVSKGYVKKLEITYDNNKTITDKMYKA